MFERDPCGGVVAELRFEDKAERGREVSGIGGCGKLHQPPRQCGQSPRRGIAAGGGKRRCGYDQFQPRSLLRSHRNILWRTKSENKRNPLRPLFCPESATASCE